MPHGTCYLWHPALLWLHIASDVAIGLAYFAIPSAMYFLLRKRDFPFSWMVVLFALFILACGITHFMNVWTIWFPNYWVSGIFKLVTAIVSVVTAVTLFPLLPKILQMPSLEKTLTKLEQANEKLSLSQQELTLKVEDRTQELQKSKQWAEEIIQGLPGLFYVFDSQVRLVHWNRNFAEVTGYSPQELLGKHAVEFIAPKDRERVAEQIGKVFSLGKSDVEAPFLTREGKEIPYYFNGVLVDWDHAAHFLGVGIDITERKKLEHELILAKEEADLASQAKSNFVATISHEIRTPMNVVMAMTELLEESSLNNSQKEYIRRLHTANSSLLTLINQILDLAKMEAGRLELSPEPVDVRHLLQNMADMMRGMAQTKNVPLHVMIKDRLPPWLMMDRTRLHQICLNLLGNALKFTEQGKITLGAEVAGIPQMIHITVSDTGIGMDAKQLDRIFTPFNQADVSITRRYGGTGLGLAISRRLVELMEGRLWVESQLGVGSTFHVLLPLRPCAGPEKSPHPEVLAPESSVPSLNLLLVDDAEENQVVMEAFLQGTPHRWQMANNGAEAVEMVKNHPFDLVFMDVQMPIKDGYTATREIRAWENQNQRRPIPIIALTAHALDGEMERSREAGCSLYLTKPIHKKKFLAVIQQYTPQVARQVP